VSVTLTYEQLRDLKVPAGYIIGADLARPGDVVTVRAGFDGCLYTHWPRLTWCRRALCAAVRA
jgi:hypothetical protein